MTCNLFEFISRVAVCQWRDLFGVSGLVACTPRWADPDEPNIEKPQEA